MLDLALAVACSLSIGMIFKHAARRGMDRAALLTVNYALAFGVGAALLGVEGVRGVARLPAGLVVLGVTTGTLFIVGFFLLALATEVAGMSLAIGVMRVSVVVPFMASWAVWGEVPSLAQGMGLLVAGVAFFLIARRARRAPEATRVEAAPEPASGATGSARVFLVLALLFLVGGLVDVLLKTFDETYAAAFPADVFLLLLFAVAFALGAVVVVGRGLRTGRWPAAGVLAWGLVLGAANYGSVKFLLRAIQALSGPFVFPANNIALVIGAALLGVFFWGERLSRTNWLGLALAGFALVLLSLGR